jgi:hypothetical protein
VLYGSFSGSFCTTNLPKKTGAELPDIFNSCRYLQTHRVGSRGIPPCLPHELGSLEMVTNVSTEPSPVHQSRLRTRSVEAHIPPYEFFGGFWLSR